MNNFASIDILLLAVIAGVVIYRLYRTLGTNTEVEDKPKKAAKPADSKKTTSKTDQKVQPLFSPAEERRNREAMMDEDEFETSEEINKSYADIAALDSTFTEKSFLEGASIAFDMVVNAHAQGDTKTLKSLLSPDLFDEFCAEIKRRRSDNQTIELEVIGIDNMSITGTKIDGAEVTLIVTIESEQAFAVYDADRNLIDGHADELTDVCDVWHFHRDTQSSNPNWTLIQTEVAEDA